MPPKPRAAASRSVSTGKTSSSSHSRANGIISSRAKARAVSLIARCSSVSSKSIAATDNGSACERQSTGSHIRHEVSTIYETWKLVGDYGSRTTRHRGVEIITTPVKFSTVGSAWTRWGQLVLGIACMVMTANLQYGWTLFIDPIEEKYHWGRAAIQVAFTIFIVTETWAQPIGGYLIDRFGPKPVVCGGR